MTPSHFFSWLHWDPSPVAFFVPYIHHPIVWYGILFVTGFICAYFIINPILARFIDRHCHFSREDKRRLFGKSEISSRQIGFFLTDRLCWFIMIGTIVGARLGAVLFYDFPYFREHPIEIFKIWHGGLASHGGTLGVLIALYLYTLYSKRWIPQLSFLRLLDYVAVPSALVACFIRLGNFMNQEIVGTPTTLPWGIIFGHPADGSSAVPRHPVQLYEAMAYLIIFCILWYVWKKQLAIDRPGTLIGLLFVLVFGSRFLLEFWKAPLDSIIDIPLLQMGQILSIPFIVLGFYLFWHAKRVNA